MKRMSLLVFSWSNCFLEGEVEVEKNRSVSGGYVTSGRRGMT